jgi:hypothetical protein
MPLVARQHAAKPGAAGGVRLSLIEVGKRVFHRLTAAKLTRSYHPSDGFEKGSLSIM